MCFFSFENSLDQIEAARVLLVVNIFYTSNSHDYTAALPCYESISYEIKHRKSFILPILSHKFGMYNLNTRATGCLKVIRTAVFRVVQK